MQDLHINVSVTEMTITCGNCDAKITPADADEKPSSIYRAGYYTCPNCSINIAISHASAELGTIGVMQNCLDNMRTM